MIQRNWRQLAFVAPIALAMFLGSAGARAQATDLEAAEKSVDPAMVLVKKKRPCGPHEWGVGRGARSNPGGTGLAATLVFPSDSP